MGKLWEQLEGEPGAAYARFLLYRNLGPTRSLDTAYQVTKSDSSLQAPGNWAAESNRYQWVERSTAWDIEMLAAYGERAIIDYVAAIRKIAQKSLEALERESIKPKDWKSAISGIELLARLISADAPGALYQSRKDEASSSD